MVSYKTRYGRIVKEPVRFVEEFADHADHDGLLPDDYSEDQHDWGYIRELHQPRVYKPFRYDHGADVDDVSSIASSEDSKAMMLEKFTNMSMDDPGNNHDDDKGMHPNGGGGAVAYDEDGYESSFIDDEDADPDELAAWAGGNGEDSEDDDPDYEPESEDETEDLDESNEEPETAV